MSEPFYVDIDRLVFPRPVPAGLNFLVLGSLTYLYRGTNEDVEPIVIRRVAEGSDIYRIVDGRHRTASSMAGGRSYVLAVEE